MLEPLTHRKEVFRKRQGWGALGQVHSWPGSSSLRSRACQGGEGAPWASSWHSAPNYNSRIISFGSVRKEHFKARILWIKMLTNRANYSSVIWIFTQWAQSSHESLLLGRRLWWWSGYLCPRFSPPHSGQGILTGVPSVHRKPCWVLPQVYWKLKQTQLKQKFWRCWGQDAPPKVRGSSDSVSGCPNGILFIFSFILDFNILR